MERNQGGGWFPTLANTVTKRTSVMTPLIVLNFLLAVFATVIYFKDGSWFLFVFLAVTLTYTLWKYEKFSKKEPWMLSSERIQKYGMRLTLGDSSSELSAKEVIDLKPIDNPQRKSISEGGDK